MPFFPQVYSDYESNPQLRQAIEFACHQFYILHRKPFVLQLFASVAPLLEFPVSGSLEINVDQVKKSKGSLFRICYSNGVSHCDLCLGKDSKADRGVRDFMVEKREDFRYALTGGHGCGGAVSRLTRRQGMGGHILCNWLGVHIWLSLTGLVGRRDKD